MKRFVIILAGLALAAPALAGPRVPRSELKDLSSEALAAAEELEAQLVSAEQAYEAAKVAASEYKDKIKVAKLTVKSKKEQLDADKAELKAAKKGKDKGRVKEVKAKIDASDAEIEAAKENVDVLKIEADLADSTELLLKAKVKMLEADVEFTKAQAVADAGGEIDLPKFELVLTEEKLTYDQERTRHAELEAKLNAKTVE